MQRCAQAPVKPWITPKLVTTHRALSAHSMLWQGACIPGSGLKRHPWHHKLAATPQPPDSHSSREVCHRAMPEQDSTAQRRAAQKQPSATPQGATPPAHDLFVAAQETSMHCRKARVNLLAWRTAMCKCILYITECESPSCDQNVWSWCCRLPTAADVSVSRAARRGAQDCLGKACIGMLCSTERMQCGHISTQVQVT